MRRSLLTLGALAAAAFLTPRANASIITASFSIDAGPAIPSICVGGVNAPLSCNFGNAPLFSQISLTATGNPPLPGADLSTTTLDATSAPGFTGTHVLHITVDQTGLSFAAGSAQSTFTVNHLIGGPFGPATETTVVNGATLASATFPSTTNATTASTNAINATITSDAHTYAITFTAAGQSANDTSPPPRLSA